MKYTNFHLYSHPRSGSHYICYLLAENFFNTEDYLQYYVGHSPPGDARVQQSLNRPGTAVIYTYRNVEETCKSIFRMRSRFGLREDDYETFMKRTFRSMFHYGGSVKIEVNNVVKGRTETKVDRLFANRNVTPGEHVTRHQEAWKRAPSNDKIILINYDKITTDFETEMGKLAEKLGQTPESFTNIYEKVGWIPS